MIDHMVLLRIPEERRGEALAELTPAVEALATIDGVEHLSWGPNASGEGEDHGFTDGFVARMRDPEALAAYGPHPTHRVVADAVGRWAEDVLVFDVEA